MAWTGKIIGGTLGAIIGGPIGAAIGAGVGNFFDSEPEESVDPEFIKLFTLLTMLGKLAKADGVISKSEAEFMRDFVKKELELEGDIKEKAITILNNAKSVDISFDKLAEAFYTVTANEKHLHLSVLHILFSLAKSDNILHPEEERMIRTASQAFNIDESIYLAIKQDYFPDTIKHYETLGCSPSSSDDEIKTQYKKLVKEYHPDKLPTNIPSAFIDFANQKFNEIQTAYSVIREERRI